jgi:3-oxoacyl-[acyl-carrier protein] reductase
MQGFTKTLAIELGKFGVTANSIAPGFIQTEMTAATAERIGVPFDDFIKFSAEQIPVGSGSASPRTSPPPSSFLCSARSAGFVSGQVIYVAGGPKA